MKSLKQWFDDYSVSHKNPSNKKIHYICVPLIMYSLLGLLSFLKLPIGNQPQVFNGASLLTFIALIFYLSLSVRYFLLMGIITLSFLISIQYFSNISSSFFQINIAIFILAWIGQFVGHKIEGKKPSFLQDLSFLLIGPLWVFENLIPISKLGKKTKNG